MQTIAQQLNIKDFPLEIKDKNGNRIYFEDSYGFWIKMEHDSNNNVTYRESSEGYWYKNEFDSNSNEIYYEDSIGNIIDNRPKTEIQKALELLEKEGMIVDGKVLKN